MDKKIFEIDMTSIVELDSVIKQLVKIKKSLINAAPEKNIKQEQRVASDRKMYESINSIYDSVITDIYKDIDDNIVSDYYVYFHCDPTYPISAIKDAKNLFAALIGLTHRPFYVGMGCGDRCYDTTRNDSYAKKKQQLSRNKTNILIMKHSSGLLKSEALALESKFIDIFGLISYSPFNWLVNLDEGKDKDARRDLYIKGSHRALRANKMIQN